MSALRIVIPEGLSFEALKLTRASTGPVKFDWAPIEQICAGSGIDIALLRDGPEDNVAGLIIGWYAEHRAHGGAPDPVAEDLIDEARAEDAHGSGLSHQPGTA